MDPTIALEGSNLSALEPWPPQAWIDGETETLSTTELALLVADAQPGTNRAASVIEDLDRLDELPPVYEATAQRSLEGLARALWHQDQARADLTPLERVALADLGPGDPVPEDADGALNKIHRGHVLLAGLALADAAEDIEALLEQADAPTVVGDHLRKHLDHEPRQPNLIPQGPSEASELVHLVDQLTDPPLGVDEEAALAHELSKAPTEGRQAIGHILQALLPFAHGPPADHQHALIELGDAIDASRWTLETWAAQATAHRLHEMQTLPSVEIDVPDANAKVPPLGVGVASGAAPAPEAPEDLAEAIEDIALAYNDTQTAADAKEHAEPLTEGLPEDQQEALSSMLVAIAAYQRGLEGLAEHKVPTALQEDPSLVRDWANRLDEGALVTPGSDEAQVLKEAQPFMDALLDVLEARAELLGAAQELVPSFTQPASSSSSTFENPCDVDPGLQNVRVSIFLQADFCGVDRVWEEDAMLTLDVGGDDLYTHRAAAPFFPHLANGQPVWSPVAFTLDFGGSDTYEPEDTEPCSLGATCRPEDLSGEGIAEDLSGGEIGKTLQASSPVAVLVDWAGDGTETENEFVGGGASQGVAVDVGYGVLIERAGQDASLSSTYEAGFRSQGYADLPDRQLSVEDQQEAEISGAFVRLIGDGSQSSASINAGGSSQGSASTGATLDWYHIRGLFLNLAGDRTEAENEYRAGGLSQAASAVRYGGVVAFLDFAGEDSSMDNVYEAGDESQGYGSQAGVTDRFTDDILAHHLPMFISAAGSGSTSNNEFVMPAEGEDGDGGKVDAVGRGYFGLFVSAVAPSLGVLEDPVEQDDENSTVKVDPSASGGDSNNDDVYIGAPRGYGSLGNGDLEGLALFVDVGGDNEYPEDARSDLEDAPCNNCQWEWGVDGEVSDSDGDGFLDIVHALWPGDPLWEADHQDEDKGPSPTPARALIQLVAKDITVDRSYALVLTVGGDHTYTKNASAGLLFDLAGKDRYEGQVGAAGFDLPHNLLAFALDLGGNDAYIAPGVNRTQGYAQAGASGLVFNMAGSNKYWAKSHAQGAANGSLVAEGSPGDEGSPADEVMDQGMAVANGTALGVLFDGTDPVEDDEEVNMFRLGESPGQGEGIHGGVGLLVGAGDQNHFASGGETADDQASTLPEDEAYQEFREIDEACKEEDIWPSPGTRCTERAGEEIDAGEEGGFGASVNLGSSADLAHQEIEITLPETEPDEPALTVNESYPFTATITHPDGDDVEFCWAIEHDGVPGTYEECERVHGSHQGAEELTSSIAYTWENVHTRVKTSENGDIQDPELNRTFTITVAAEDSSGARTEKEASVDVGNEPLPLKHLDEDTLLLGPTEVTGGEGSVLYQLPVTDTGERDRVTTRAAFGNVDLSENDNVRDATSIDWAQQTAVWTPTVRMPEAATAIEPVKNPGDPLQVDVTDTARPSFVGDKEAILDGDLKTGPTFSVGGGKIGDPPAHFQVDLPQPRQVYEINMAAETDDFIVNDTVTFTVEGIGPEGDRETLGTLEYEHETGEVVNAIIPVDLGVYESFVVRHQDPRTPSSGTVEVTSFGVHGPGVEVPGLDSGGTLTVGVVDAFGGVNQTTVEIGEAEGQDEGADEGDAEEKASLPVRVVDLAGKGAPKHLTLVKDRPQPYELVVVLEDEEMNPSALCVDHGGEDGDLDCDPEPLENHEDTYVFQLEWGTTGPKDLVLKHQEADAFEAFHVATVHVEEGLDLRVEGDPILFVGLEGTHSWHYADREMGVPNHLAVVSGGEGNDRFIGDQAVPRPLLNTPDTVQGPVGASAPRMDVLRPSFVFSHGGNDDFLSQGSFTQGFGYFGSVGMLWNAGGDDRYVAASHGQGAGYKQGVGMLVDRGGNDAYNPVRAQHPGLVKYLPLVENAIEAGNRSELLDAAKRPLGPMPDARLVQGAGDEGVGVIISEGGHDLFAAGERAQGFGQHGAQAAEDYAVPASGQDCPEPSDALQGTGLPPSGFNANVLIFAATCPAGFQLNLDAQNPGQNTGPGGFVNPGILGGQGDHAANPFATQEPLVSFVEEGPRYGPGVGMLFKGEGSSVYHALERAQGASDPAGRGLMVDQTGGFVGSAFDRAQGFTEGGQAGLVAGGAHSLWLGGDGKGDKEKTAEDPEHPSGVDRPEEKNETTTAQYVPVEDPRDTGLTLSWNRSDDHDDPGDYASVGEAFTGEELDLAVDIELDEGEEGSNVEFVAITQPWPIEGGICAYGEAPMSAPILMHQAETEVGTEAFTLDLMETVGGQALYPAGCHEVHVFVRAVSEGQGTSPWEELEERIVLLPPPEAGIQGEGIEVVTNADAHVAFDLASGQVLPLSGFETSGLTIDLKLVDDKTGATRDMEESPGEAPWTPGLTVSSPDVDPRTGKVKMDLCEGDFEVAFETFPEGAKSLAFVLKDRNPNTSATWHQEAGWEDLEGDRLNTTFQGAQLCPEERPAREDRAFVVEAHALEGERPDTFDPGQWTDVGWRSFLHAGNVLASGAMPIKATDDEVPAWPGNLSAGTGVMHAVDWQAETDVPEGTYTVIVTACWQVSDACFNKELNVSVVVHVDSPPTSLNLVDPASPEEDLGDCQAPDMEALAPDGVSCWKRTDPLRVEGEVQEDNGDGDSAAPTRVHVRAVHDSGGELAVIERAVSDEPAWSVDALDLLGNLSPNGGLVEFQARVEDEAENVPSWDDVPHSQMVYFDGQAPSVDRIETPGGTTATGQTLGEISLSLVLKDVAAGVNASSLEAFVVDQDTFVTCPLDTEVANEAPGDVKFNLSWNNPCPPDPTLGAASDPTPNGDDLPPEGFYRVVVEAEDQVGNQLVIHPGQLVEVDREPPEINDLKVQIPENQDWVGNGTPIAIEVKVEDPVSNNVQSGIHPDHVFATFDGNQILLEDDEEQTDLWSGTLTVQGDETATGTQFQESLTVNVCDQADNCKSDASDPFTYYPAPPTIQDLDIEERGASATLTWTTDRHATVNETETSLNDQATDTNLEPEIDSDGLNHTIVFPTLRPETTYHGTITMNDQAGYHIQEEITVETVQEIQGTDVTLDPIQRTLSGTINVTGRAVQSTGGELSLHTENPEDPINPLGPPIETIQVDRGESVSFEITVDTTQPPVSAEKANNVTFVAVLSDGADAWTARTEVRLDNAPPRIQPTIQGPDPHNGWYTGPIHVDANAHDRTGPITYRSSIDGTGPIDQRAVTIREDGTHEIQFWATDAATPPNTAAHTMTVSIDRITPHLNASLTLPHPATAHPVIPLNVEANVSRAGPSGLDGFRVLTGAEEGPWQEDPLERAVLASISEGERWIEVQARDKAGNIATQTIPLVLDRTPPELLQARWLEGNGTHDEIRITAQDRMNGPGGPAGVTALRWAPGLNGAWSSWTPTEGSTTLDIPDLDVDALRLQLKDAAGNEGPVEVLRPGEPVERLSEDVDLDQAGSPSEDVLAQPEVTPDRGTKDTRFAFSVNVHPWKGQAPEKVWVTVGEQEIRLHGGGLLEDGARLYTGSSTLEAVDIHNEPSYQFHATYLEGGTVSTAPQPAPVVSEATSEELAGEVGLLQEVPVLPVGAGVIVVLVSGVALFVWRRRGGG